MRWPPGRAEFDETSAAPGNHHPAEEDRMMKTMAIRGLLVAAAFAAGTTAASAQVFGTFTWQMQP